MIFKMYVPNLTFVYDRKGQAKENKPAPIELVISLSGQRKYVTTGIRVLPKEWSYGRVVGRLDWMEINEQLNVIIKKCSEVITQMMEEGNFDINAVPNRLKEAMFSTKTFLEYAREIAEVRKRKLARGTWQRYEVFFNFMKEWGKITYFCDLTERNITALDNELMKRGLKECSRYNYHKLMKLFIKQAVNDNIIKSDPYVKLDIKKGTETGIISRVLTPNEFHQLEKAKMPNLSTERVRDLFVFQTYTLMSYADLVQFDYSKCAEVNGMTVYKAKRQKTNVEFVTVLFKPALDILKKYNYKLPIISNVNYNAYIKTAAIYAGLEKENISTHWARHTGATLLLNEKKVPIHVIQHVLGHSSIRETEKTYARVLDETIIEEMRKVGTKVGIAVGISD